LSAAPGGVGPIIHPVPFTQPEMFMPVGKVYRKLQMLCIDGRKQEIGRMREHRK
jgi:hypothetical protein